MKESKEEKCKECDRIFQCMELLKLHTRQDCARNRMEDRKVKWDGLLSDVKCEEYESLTNDPELERKFGQNKAKAQNSWSKVSGKLETLVKSDKIEMLDENEIPKCQINQDEFNQFIVEDLNQVDFSIEEEVQQTKKTDDPPLIYNSTMFISNLPHGISRQTVEMTIKMNDVKRIEMKNNGALVEFHTEEALSQALRSRMPITIQNHVVKKFNVNRTTSKRIPPSAQQKCCVCELIFYSEVEAKTHQDKSHKEYKEIMKSSYGTLNDGELRAFSPYTRPEKDKMDKLKETTEDHPRKLQCSVCDAISENDANAQKHQNEKHKELLDYSVNLNPGETAKLYSDVTYQNIYVQAEKSKEYIAPPAKPISFPQPDSTNNLKLSNSQKRSYEIELKKKSEKILELQRECQEKDRRINELENKNKKLKLHRSKPAQTHSEKKEEETSSFAKSENGSLYEPDLINLIESSVLKDCKVTEWEDIADLEGIKTTLYETIVVPQLCPGAFVGVLSPPKGVLLVGPPGTGKTMLAKAVASKCGTTFLNITPSLVNSKWMGDGEKMVKLIFAYAQFRAPSTIFWDELDGVGSQRGGSGESDASRKIKSELLVQMDGVKSLSDSGKNVTVIAATNFPWDIDEALKRRFSLRLYIPLPTQKGLESLLKIQLRDCQLVHVDLKLIASHLKGYSGADVKAVCNKAAWMDVRRKLGPDAKLDDESERAKLEEDLKNCCITHEDFMAAITTTKKSVKTEDIYEFEKWMQQYGSS